MQTKVCREYITAMRLELGKREEKNPVRQCELAAYFTKCDIKPLHLILGLKMAIKSAFAVKNFQTAGGFCRRILELAVSSSQPGIERVIKVKQIKGVLKHCEAANSNAQDINYNEVRQTAGTRLSPAP